MEEVCLIIKPTVHRKVLYCIMVRTTLKNSIPFHKFSSDIRSTRNYTTTSGIIVREGKPVSSTVLYYKICFFSLIKKASYNLYGKSCLHSNIIHSKNCIPARKKKKIAQNTIKLIYWVILWIKILRTLVMQKSDIQSL